MFTYAYIKNVKQLLILKLSLFPAYKFLLKDFARFRILTNKSLELLKCIYSDKYQSERIRKAVYTNVFRKYNQRLGLKILNSKINKCNLYRFRINEGKGCEKSSY